MFFITDCEKVKQSSGETAQSDGQWVTYKFRNKLQVFWYFESEIVKF